MHPALLVPCVVFWPLGVPVMFVLYLRHRDHGLDLRKPDHAMAAAMIPVMIIFTFIITNDCLVLRCVDDYQIDSFSKGIELGAVLVILSGLVGLTRWLRLSLSTPDRGMKRPLAGSVHGNARAAATLPSRQVLVFDARGAIVDEACGHYDSVKQRVFTDLSAEGRFFWIHSSMDPFWERTNIDHGDGTGGGYVPYFQLELTAIECTPAEWLEGGKKGQPAARRTWVWRGSGGREIPPDDIWRLIREAALGPGVASGA